MKIEKSALENIAHLAELKFEEKDADYFSVPKVLYSISYQI